MEYGREETAPPRCHERTVPWVDKLTSIVPRLTYKCRRCKGDVRVERYPKVWSVVVMLFSAGYLVPIAEVALFFLLLAWTALWILVALILLAPLRKT